MSSYGCIYYSEFYDWDLIEINDPISPNNINMRIKITTNFASVEYSQE